MKSAFLGDTVIVANDVARGTIATSLAPSDFYRVKVRKAAYNEKCFFGRYWDCRQ
jgi:hypothetical protein